MTSLILFLLGGFIYIIIPLINKIVETFMVKLDSIITRELDKQDEKVSNPIGFRTKESNENE